MSKTDVIGEPAHEAATGAAPGAAKSWRGGLADWLDNRTGYRDMLHEALDEPIPGGARWRYVFGSALTSTFMIQLVTGVLLMLSYSPSSSTAWGSVYFINYGMTGGWIIRGIHHFGSQAMVVLLVLHLLQVLVAGAYRAPREVNWWFGMALLFVTVGFSLTGYLLPWDQKGFWATKVATKIAGGTPGLGPAIERIIVGGTEYGNQTLTRFYGLHVGVLPALLVLCLAAHVALFRRHGVTAPPKAQGMDRFWPKQVFMDSAVSLGVLFLLLFLVWKEGGANLDAPADPSSSEYPARPEWYFLSLFQLLKKFPGKYEFVGTMVVPGAIVSVLLLLPLLDRLLPRKFAHFLACMLVFALIGGAGYLTVEAIRADESNPRFQESRRMADASRNRALELAAYGISPDGPSYLLLRDPLTNGRTALEKKCLGCHSFGDQGAKLETAAMKGADLKGFGSKQWVRGLLENPESPAYGVKVPTSKGSKILDGMKEWKEGNGAGYDSKELDQLADLVAGMASLPVDATPEDWAADPKVKAHPAYQAFVEDCLSCHSVGRLGSESKSRQAPSLFGWGSPAWMTRMVRHPDSKTLYGFLPKNQQMPVFDDQMTDNDLQTLVRYVKGDYPGAGKASPAPSAVTSVKPR